MGCGASKVSPTLAPPPPIRKHWEKQVFDEAQSKFKPFDGWKETFEPVKERKEKAEPTEAELKKDAEKAAAKRARQQRVLSKALDVLSGRLTDRAARLMMEFVATLLSHVSHAAEKDGQAAVAELANALGALAATFRFAHHGQHKFRYIRRGGAARAAQPEGPVVRRRGRCGGEGGGGHREVAAAARQGLRGRDRPVRPAPADAKSAAPRAEWAAVRDRGSR